ncbi:gamma-glutamyltransferase [Thioflexithrix psekupsensis]|uniref:Glutathione hydrolase proenzyme n=1 Tax=Thioflexithrix psekupsensis TaxID=1570016 RepID=A0A251X359_9GAMM|nr:gamma-glutamyltransferase [Thioflexithrix psekupsensis]OUD11715.1 gamma-glutamyltransferase [Thioflexithrix psekupsensis]
MSYFQSRRSAVLARRGAVATSQPLAAQAGLQMLMAGGNAVDAAVAAAATLAVVEPMSTGLGGDLFCLIWDAKTKQVYALNSSGRAPAHADPEAMRRKGYQKMPLSGADVACSVTVPGTVAGWEAALRRHGRMSFKEVLQPAIMYAETGFPVSELIATMWQEAESKLTASVSGQELLYNGRAPRYGDVVVLSTLAKSLRQLYEGGAAAFYEGELARQVADYVQKNGGWLTVDDLRQHQATWETPLNIDYRGTTVWQCPPNGQGLTVLSALNLLQQFDVKDFPAQTSARYHLLIEIMRLAFADGLHYITDPRTDPVPVAALLDKTYAKNRAALIHPDHALQNVSYGIIPPSSDTIYVSAVDSEGHACSLINSTFQSFGSGLVVPKTGISLQNRGAGFNLIEGHPRCLAPEKRPYHTIIPGMATKNGEFYLSFGVMGAFQQPQGQLQVLNHLLDEKMDIQAALDALRFGIDLETNVIRLEAGVPQEIVDGLQKRGHCVTILDGWQRMELGGGQAIIRDPETGVLFAGSEPRKDGAAVGF